MTFFLGTHEPSWLETAGVPLFVSRRRLARRVRLPRATSDWALDSGGFTELELHGGWGISPRDYAAEVRRYRQEVGRMVWAPVMDWMCEPWMLARTGLGVAEHQRRTTESYLTLSELAPDVPWVPVLQGWQPDDYRRHWQQYDGAGVDLEALSLVGLGSVCRRQHTPAAAAIVRGLAGLSLHGFGVKITGITAFGEQLTSADSLAWSLHARKKPPMFAECRHQSCANCRRWALAWRQTVLERAASAAGRPRQLALAFDAFLS